MVMERLAEMAVPTLVLAGEPTARSTRRRGQYLERKMPHARLQVVAGGEHNMQESHAAEIAGGHRPLRSVGDRAVDQAAQLAAEVERRRRHQLGHEHHPQVLDAGPPRTRSTPRRPSRSRPAGSAPVAHLVDGAGEAEPEPDADVAVAG